MHKEEGRTVETAVEARAGFRDRPVLRVLGYSLVLGAVVLGLLWLWFASHTPPGATALPFPALSLRSKTKQPRRISLA
jgi:hypothetical protein